MIIKDPDNTKTHFGIKYLKCRTYKYSMKKVSVSNLIISSGLPEFREITICVRILVRIIILHYSGIIHKEVKHGLKSPVPNT